MAEISPKTAKALADIQAVILEKIDQAVQQTTGRIPATVELAQQWCAIDTLLRTIKRKEAALKGGK